MISNIVWNDYEMHDFFAECAEYVQENIAKKFNIKLELKDIRDSVSWSQLTAYVAINDTDVLLCSITYASLEIKTGIKSDSLVLNLDNMPAAARASLKDFVCGKIWEEVKHSQELWRVIFNLIRKNWNHQVIARMCDTCADIIYNNRGINVNYAKLGLEDDGYEAFFAVDSDIFMVPLHYVDIVMAIFPDVQVEDDLVWFDEIDLSSLTKEQQISLGKYIIQAIWTILK